MTAPDPVNASWGTHRGLLSRAAYAVMAGLIHVWRYGISPVIGPRCRFYPSCSEYGLQALAHHGPWRGGVLTMRRVCRCHPWSPGGHDPVPDRSQASFFQADPQVPRADDSSVRQDASTHRPAASRPER